MPCKLTRKSDPRRIVFAKLSVQIWIKFSKWFTVVLKIRIGVLRLLSCYRTIGFFIMFNSFEEYYLHGNNRSFTIWKQNWSIPLPYSKVKVLLTNTAVFLNISFGKLRPIRWNEELFFWPQNVFFCSFSELTWHNFLTFWNMT